MGDIIEIIPGKLKGDVTLPPSKSILHRLLICSCAIKLFNKAVTKDIVIDSTCVSSDVFATMNCLRHIGANIEYTGSSFIIKKGLIKNKDDAVSFNCCESASTLRFMIPFAMLSNCSVNIYGEGRLPKRPMNIYYSELARNGVVIDKLSEDMLPVHIHCNVKDPIKVRFPGDITSQYISGILMMLPYMPSGSSVSVDGKTESDSYVCMTVNTMMRFGVTVECNDTTYTVKDRSGYSIPESGVLRAEADWSAAAFWLTANKLGSKVNCKGLSHDTCQGDSAIVRLLDRIGYAETIDCADVPDLVPVLCVAAAAAKTKTVLLNTRRLKYKECDRAMAISQIISDLGGSIENNENCIIIYGQGHLKGGIIRSYGDHRIAMTAAIAAGICENSVTLIDPFVTDKSYATFFKDFIKLGGKYNVI